MDWRGSEALAFLETIPLAQSAAEICNELARVVPLFGMSWYFIGGAVPPGHPLLPVFKFHNWPGALMEAYSQSELIEHNPIPRITAISARTITFAEYRGGRAGFTPSPASEPLFALLAAHRMSHALIVPIHGPRGPRGFGLFSGPGPDPCPRARALLGLMAHLAFMRLQDLDGRPAMDNAREATLTEREIEMLHALAEGHDDAGIAAQYHIAVRTVRFHLANARHKLGARSRAEALILAAKGGFLSR